MSRTVVTFVGKARTFLMLDDTAHDIALEDLSEVDLTALPQGTPVQLGEALLAVLNGDPAVKQGLSSLLLRPIGSEPAPLYFRIRAAAADTVPWEQLHADSKGFVALDPRWPIGRIARQRTVLETRAFTPPLRVVAVLSAAGRDGTPQLDALAAARDGARLPVHLHVVSGDEALVERARARGIDADPISPSGPGLMRQIALARPHVLHVLCHGGGAAGGERRLVFADSNDLDAAQLDPTVLGSVFVSVNQLASALLSCSPWLVVLGACETAGAGPGAVAGAGAGTALAHDLVSGGVPAAIGMRRLVDVTAADAFCREFYPEAFDLVARTLDRTAGPISAQPTRVLDWAHALTGPRRAMGGPDPETVDSWTDPVLYAQYGDLAVSVPQSPATAADRAEILGRIDSLEGGLAVAVAGGAGPALLEELRALIADARDRLGGQG